MVKLKRVKTKRGTPGLLGRSHPGADHARQNQARIFRMRRERKIRYTGQRMRRERQKREQGTPRLLGGRPHEKRAAYAQAAHARNYDGGRALIGAGHAVARDLRTRKPRRIDAIANQPTARKRAAHGIYAQMLMDCG